MIWRVNFEASGLYPGGTVIQRHLLVVLVFLGEKKDILSSMWMFCYYNFATFDFSKRLLQYFCAYKQHVYHSVLTGLKVFNILSSLKQI